MLRNVFAVVGGIAFGSIVNMLLVTTGSALIPAPDGVDVSDPASMAAGAHLFEARHFVFPFLAHAVGTLVGALTAAVLATVHKLWFALGIGVLNLAGGITAAFLIPVPIAFIALDVTLAYVPMACLGWFLATRFAPAEPNLSPPGDE